MPRAFILTSYPFPDSAATANRVGSFAAALADLPDWEVTVISPGPKKKENTEPPANKNIETYYRLAPEFTRSNLVGRAIGEIRQTFRLLRAARNSCDVLVVTVPSVFLMLAVLWPGRNRAVIDLRDLVWEYLTSSQGMERWAGIVLRYGARLLLKRAEAITVTNDHEAQDLKSLVDCEPVVVRNGISRDRFERLAALSPSSNNDESSFHIVYVGNLGIAQELDSLIRAVKGDPTFRITLVGGGNDYARLQRILEEESIENVNLTGPLSWDQTLEYYSSADCLFGQIGSSYLTAVPSKIFEYVSCGRPVVFAVPEGPAAVVIRMFNGTYRIPPGDPEAIARKLEEVREGGRLEFSDIAKNKEKIQTFFIREEISKDFAGLVSRVYGGLIKI